MEKGKTDMEENLIRAQAMEDVRNDLFPLTDQEPAYVAALQAQMGYADANGKINYSDIAVKHLPRRLIVSGIEKEIEKKHIELKGKTYAEAADMFMKFIRQWPLYGSTIFEVWVKKSEIYFIYSIFSPFDICIIFYFNIYFNTLSIFFYRFISNLIPMKFQMNVG